MVEVYDSKRGTVVTEAQFGGSVLNFLYNTIIGRVLLKMVFLQPWVWRWAALLQKRPSTMDRVHRYVKDFEISPADYVDSNWRSFYDFFSRELTPGALTLPVSKQALISVAESKLLVLPITRTGILNVKHRQYDLASIVGSSELAQQYEGGTALIYRLSMHNYHRYIFPDDGRIGWTKVHKGVLHTVSSISHEFPVYSLNQRQVSVLHTERFSDVTMVEVGAMMAGKIINHPVAQFDRGQEKGGFKIGGSTILVLYKKSTVTLRDDLDAFSKKGIEVTVGIGEEIGHHV